MLPLYEDPHFTFRFADDRVVPRFHLEGVPAGRRVLVFGLDPGTGGRRDLLATATAGEGGWVDLPAPLAVRAGEAFVAVPDPDPLECSPQKLLLTAVGVAALLAAVGYLGGLALGGGNEALLALCCGAPGAFFLLGYGPVALLIGVLGAGAEWLRGKKREGPRTS
jgi:hypothetical protein